MSNHAGKAVIPSYASQDAEAARKICDALRAAGIDVWFDRSELRGGDAWDHKIRKQIKECTLFVPIISANTQARAEGYFRREWRLAVDRTHDMADDEPFLVPVVIDGTPDAAARVPERFRERQWTRLLDGETSNAFVDRVVALLKREATKTHSGARRLDARARRADRAELTLTAKASTSWTAAAVTPEPAEGFWRFRAPSSPRTASLSTIGNHTTPA